MIQLDGAGSTKFESLPILKDNPVLKNLGMRFRDTTKVIKSYKHLQHLISTSK